MSADGIASIKKFRANHKLNFTLLADPGLDAIRRYGAKMPILKMSKRGTLIIDPDLKIHAIERDVPVFDARQVAELLKESEAHP